jgi:predicted Rossmann fold nucleotide-binding protein DprA/Smf involved in DNA uptake
LKEQSDIPYWLALMGKERLVPTTLIESTFKYFNSIEPLWRETPDFLRKIGFNEIELRKFLDFRSTFRFDNFERFRKTLSENEIDVVRYVDQDYPKILRDFGNYYIKPPLTLLIKGSLRNFNECVVFMGI